MSELVTNIVIQTPVFIHTPGDVVSDGRLVQDSGGIQNAHFGIQNDGSLFFGWVSWQVYSPVWGESFKSLLLLGL